MECLGTFVLVLGFFGYGLYLLAKDACSAAGKVINSETGQQIAEGFVEGVLGSLFDDDQ